MLAFLTMAWYSWVAIGLLAVLLIAIKIYRSRQM